MKSFTGTASSLLQHIRPSCTPLVIHSIPSNPRLEWIVLWCNFLLEPFSYDRNLEHDVVANTGNLGKEKESGETSEGTEATCNGSAKKICVSLD